MLRAEMDPKQQLPFVTVISEVLNSQLGTLNGKVCKERQRIRDHVLLRWKCRMRPKGLFCKVFSVTSSVDLFGSIGIHFLSCYMVDLSFPILPGGIDRRNSHDATVSSKKRSTIMRVEIDMEHGKCRVSD